MLYLLSLLSNTEEEISLVQRSRSEDNIFDAELRENNLLCPGSAMFLTTVFVDNAASFTTFPKPLKDSSEEALERVSARHLPPGSGAADHHPRGHGPSGALRDRSLAGHVSGSRAVRAGGVAFELFMYHDDRKNLGWGTLNDHKFGTQWERSHLADFGMSLSSRRRCARCTAATTAITTSRQKKLIDDVWWRFQERMDKGEDAERIHAEAVDIALDRVNALHWVGLTHKYDESACSLAYVLRRHPVDTSGTNYDRGGLISEKFRGNHPHSDSAFEGDMSDALREELNQCNAMDTLLVDCD